MHLPCEAGVKTVVPAIRALLSKKLVERHGMNESQTAMILGLSQSAISRYKSKNRGNLLQIDNDPDVQLLLDQMIQLLLYGKPLETFKILDIFCQACSLVREKGLLCSFCQKKISDHTVGTCTFCFSKKVC
jgi:predicted transcriptional regulator